MQGRTHKQMIVYLNSIAKAIIKSKQVARVEYNKSNISVWIFWDNECESIYIYKGILSNKETIKDYKKILKVLASDVKSKVEFNQLIKEM